MPPPPPAPDGSTGPVPVGNPGEWVTTGDYPLKALREEKEGMTGFKLTVSPAGWVKNCEIVSSSGVPELDEATCRLVTMRATFKPATDAKGVPGEGIYSNRVRWVVPQDVPQPTPGSVAISMIVEKDGSQSDCQIIRSDPGMTGAPPVGPVPCLKKWIDPPFTNAKGEPIRKRVTQTMSITIEDVEE